MEYVQLGKSDLKVSRICLGCMGFGFGGGDYDWVNRQEEADKIVKKALELGINFFDTANCYCNGTSEIVLGNALRKYAKREDVIIASKVYFNDDMLSRKAILREIEGSLQRLGTDYLDLYIIHRFDYNTPMEEVMETLHELVKSGKVRHIGASAMYAYQFAKLQDIARAHGWTEFISMQNHYNLIYREEEREMMKLLMEEGVSSTPYSPLAAGRLARLWDGDSVRAKTDIVGIRKYDSHKDQDIGIVKRVKEIADKRNLPMAQIALAWLLSREGVASTIIGPMKEKHLTDAVASIDVKLSEDECHYLEELYTPHFPQGARDRVK